MAPPHVAVLLVRSLGLALSGLQVSLQLSPEPLEVVVVAAAWGLVVLLCRQSQRPWSLSMECVGVRPGMNQDGRGDGKLQYVCQGCSSSRDNHEGRANDRDPPSTHT